MAEIILNIGDIGVATKQDDVLKTFSLGSCVALVVFDNYSKIAGMVHIVLPDSSRNKEKAMQKPGYFADTAVTRLFGEMKASAGVLSRKQLMIALAGGANILGKSNVFNIGQKNVEAVRAMIKKYDLEIHREDIGGTISRTVTFSIASGLITLSSPAKGTWTL